jgi:hypothetical protein
VVHNNYMPFRQYHIVARCGHMPIFASSFHTSRNTASTAFITGVRLLSRIGDFILDGISVCEWFEWRRIRIQAVVSVPRNRAVTRDICGWPVVGERAFQQSGEKSKLS